LRKDKIARDLKEGMSAYSLIDIFLYKLLKGKDINEGWKKFNRALV